MDVFQVNGHPVSGFTCIFFLFFWFLGQLGFWLQ